MLGCGVNLTRKKIMNLKIRKILRHEFYLAFFLFSAILFSAGCGTVASFRHAHNAATEAASSAQADNQPNPIIAVTGGKLSKLTTESLPATANHTSVIARAVANIVHIAEIVGLLSLIAGGLLIYCGQVIPGVKCVIGGIVLPVSAVWFDYHYGLVLWLLLIGSAGGFLWALNKYDPALLKALDIEASKIKAAAQADIVNLVKKS
jgi:hypothetical protein